jgi:hypothetical protein
MHVDIIVPRNIFVTVLRRVDIRIKTKLNSNFNVLNVSTLAVLYIKLNNSYICAVKETEG